MKISVRPLVAGALLLSPLGTASPVYSQIPTPTTSQAELQVRQTYELPLKNVAPHLMVWWLDPANQPSPLELENPVASEAQSISLPRKAATTFALPGGIESIAPLDAKKTLLVTGNEAGVQELRKIVAFLDQPIRQIEIETHVVPMPSTKIKTFGLDFEPPFPTLRNQAERARPSFSFLNGDLSALIATLPKTGQLSEVKVPRTTVNDNLTASFVASRSYPMPTEVQNKIAALVPQNGDNPTLERQYALKFNIVPTINNDDTITLRIEIESQIQIGYKGDPNGLALADPSTITSIINMRDGQTVAIRGFDRAFASAFQHAAIPNISTSGVFLDNIPDIGAMFRSVSSDRLIVFLTPRIVRRTQPTVQ